MVYIDTDWLCLLSALYPSYWPWFLFWIKVVFHKMNGRTFWFLLCERMQYCLGIFRNNQTILLRCGCQDHMNSLYGDISTLSTYMAKMHQTPNDVHCAIFFKRNSNEEPLHSTHRKYRIRIESPTLSCPVPSNRPFHKWFNEVQVSVSTSMEHQWTSYESGNWCKDCATPLWIHCCMRYWHLCYTSGIRFVQRLCEAQNSYKTVSISIHVIQ